MTLPAHRISAAASASDRVFASAECSTCRRVLSPQSFAWRRRRRADGHYRLDRQSVCRACSAERQRRHYRDPGQALRRVWRRICNEVYGSCRFESIAEAHADLRARGHVVMVRAWWTFEGFARDMAEGFIPGRTWRRTTPGATVLGPDTMRWVHRPPTIEDVLGHLDRLPAAQQEEVIESCGLSVSARVALLEHFGLLGHEVMR